MHILGVDVWTGFWTMVATMFVGVPVKNGVLWLWRKVFPPKAKTT